MKPHSSARRQRGGAAGTFITVLLIVGLLALGAWLVMRDLKAPQPADAPATTPAPTVRPW